MLAVNTTSLTARAVAQVSHPNGQSLRLACPSAIRRAKPTANGRAEGQYITPKLKYGSNVCYGSLADEWRAVCLPQYRAAHWIDDPSDFVSEE